MQRPEIEWRGNVPVSKQFGDIYYSPEDGFAESRHVFLAGNDLERRWKGFSPARSSFQIGEIGFGTGLNFLATRDLYRSINPNFRLNYFSCEAFPLTREELERALSAFGELGDLRAELLSIYPPPQAGFHRAILADGRVTLTLLFGEAIDVFRSLERGGFDAWYLDGFAPARNPELWQPELLREVARLSAPGATASTFSVAATVRAALEGAGFEIARTPGYGRKREMLRARTRAVAPDPASVGRDAARGDAVVIGAGLAGTAMAEALTRRGRRVILIEREAGAGQAASGNAAGLAFPWLTAEPTFQSRLSLIAFFYFLGHLDRCEAAGLPIDRNECGVLQLLYSDMVAGRLKRALGAHEIPAEIAVSLDAEAASARAGWPVRDPALFFPRGTLVSARALCAAQLKLAERQGGLAVRFHRTALDFFREKEEWIVTGENKDIIAGGSELILCNAADCLAFPAAGWLPLKPVRGQVVRARSRPGQVPLGCAICYDGYITPAVGLPGNEEHWIGATFEHWNHTRTMIPEQNLRLLAMARDRLPEWVAGFPDSDRADTWPGRVAFRCTSKDRNPVVGPLPDPVRFQAIAREHEGSQELGNFPGLWINTAHGSRGLLTAPLAAEYIAATICGEPSPLPREIRLGLDPARFLRRELRKGKRFSF